MLQYARESDFRSLAATWLAASVRKGYVTSNRKLDLTEEQKMKKLMFGLAVAGLCTAVSAVESNIVG